MLVIKELITQEYVTQMRQFMLSNNFAWYYFPEVLTLSYEEEQEIKNHSKIYKDEFYGNSVFRHTFISDGGIENSGSIDMLVPVFKEMEKHIERKFYFHNCSANLTLHNPEMENKRHYPHVDTGKMRWNGYTAILYLDDSGGSTRIYKESGSYEDHFPEPGKLVLFDNTLYHSAPVSGTKNERVVINFNIKFRD